MAKKRKFTGKYYTPKHIRDYVDGKEIANPSAGSGAFLKEIYDKLMKWLTQNPPFGKSK